MDQLRHSAFQEYWDRLDALSADGTIIDKLGPHATKQQQAAAKVWRITESAISNEAKELLNILSFLQPNAIPRSVLYSIKRWLTNERRPSEKAVRICVDDSLVELANYSLIDNEFKRDMVSIHRLTQDTMRLFCVKSEQRETWLTAV